MQRATRVLGYVGLVLCLIGCGPSGEGAREIAQRLGDAVALPGEAPSPTPTTTPAPTVDISQCQPSLAFVDDLTIPDGTRIAAGEIFTKTWSIMNNGTCAWGPGFTLRFVDGEPMGLTDAVPLPFAEPGQTVSVSVPMRAPAILGTHRSNWRLSISDAFYGTTLFALIEATQPVASRTPELSPTPTTEPSATTPAAPTTGTDATPAPTSALTLDPGAALPAIVVHDAQGLWVTNRGDDDWHNVLIEVNPGLLRRGYSALVERIPSGERIHLPHEAFRRPNGTAWPPDETPWGVYIQADEGDYYAEPSVPNMAQE